jgi:hypothetical protein
MTMVPSVTVSRPVTAAAARPGVEIASVEGDALTHTNEAMTTSAAAVVLVTERRLRRPTAVIGNLENQLIWPVGQSDRRPGRPGVFQAVGQCLLNDAKDRQVNAGRKWRRFAVDDEVDRESRLFDLGDQGIQVLQPRLRGQIRGVAVIFPYHAQ